MAGSKHEAVTVTMVLASNPTCEEVCSGMTGHAKVAQAIYESTKISYGDLLKVFWENHDPTPDNDAGIRFRSAIYEHHFAEGHHQQHLAPTKNPDKHCNHGPNGLSRPVDLDPNEWLSEP